MSGLKFCVRAADAADLAGVLALERAIPEAPHWTEPEYAAIVCADRDANGMVRRGIFVAEAEGRVLGFSVGKVIALGGEGLAELESVAVKASARRGGGGQGRCVWQSLTGVQGKRRLCWS